MCLICKIFRLERGSKLYLSGHLGLTKYCILDIFGNKVLFGVSSEAPSLWHSADRLIARVVYGINYNWTNW